MCMDMHGRGLGQRVDIDDDNASNTMVFTIGDLQLPENIEEGWVCHAWVKPYADDHENDGEHHRSGHDACDIPLTD